MPEMITLECPSCGGRTTFSVADAVMRCEYCGNQHIFRLPTSGSSASGPGWSSAAQPASSSATTTAARPSLVPRPREVTLQKQGDQLILRWRWFNIKFIGLAFFCFFWDGFLCLWYGMAFGGKGAPLLVFIFPLLHLAVGISLSYYTLAGFLNVTTLKVDRKQFSVQYDPVPWLGEVKVPTADLKQLYCKEKYHSSDSGSHYSYQLCAILKDGRKLDMVPNLDSAEIAAFLEQQIESWLNIPDEPVVGEM
jgi:hypothetical protein